MLVRYTSMGEVIPQDQRKILATCVSIIITKKLGVDTQNTQAEIYGVLVEKNEFIEKFKHKKNLVSEEYSKMISAIEKTKGAKLTVEEYFDAVMINAIEKATGIKLTVEEFNDIWNSGNPKFPQFIDLLKELIEFNKQLDQKIVFISGTNVKDLRHLQAQLDEYNKDKSEKDKISYEVKDDMLCNIGGIQLITSCATGKTKVEILAEEVKLARAFEFTTPADIKYIYSPNDRNDPLLKPIKDVIDGHNEQIRKTINIELIPWDHKAYPTFGMLMSNEKTVAVPFAMAANQ